MHYHYSFSQSIERSSSTCCVILHKVSCCRGIGVNFFVKIIHSVRKSKGHKSQFSGNFVENSYPTSVAFIFLFLVLVLVNLR